MKKEELIKTVQDAVEEAYKAGYAEGIKHGNINDGTFGEKVNEAYKRGYTKGKEDGIRENTEKSLIGCEVEYADDEYGPKFGVITAADLTEEEVYILAGDGKKVVVESRCIERTGRHFPQIAEVLQQM